MKESMWGVFLVGFGILMIVVVLLFQALTNKDQQNYYLLRETTEAAMFDALDLAAYRTNGEIKISEEKFVESFIRRFASSVNANLLQNEEQSYIIEIYDVIEVPPKVSIRINTNQLATIESTDIAISNRIDAILESVY